MEFHMLADAIAEDAIPEDAIPDDATPEDTILDDAIQDSAIPDDEMEDGALLNRASHGSASVDDWQQNPKWPEPSNDNHYIYVYEYEEYTIRPTTNNDILEEEDHEDETQYCSNWYSAYVLKNFLHCQKNEH